MRVQLALDVNDLDQSIEFYEQMFDVKVAKRKPGYANFEIENPPLKLVLFEQAGASGSINHLGVETEHESEVHAANRRFQAAGLKTDSVKDTVCCFAEKSETWVAGPDQPWEWYVKHGDSHDYGQSTQPFTSVPESSPRDPDGCCS